MSYASAVDRYFISKWVIKNKNKKQVIKPYVAELLTKIHKKADIWNSQNKRQMYGS